MIDNLRNNIVKATENTKYLVESGVDFGVCHAHVLSVLTSRTDFSPVDSLEQQRQLELSVGITRSDSKYSLQTLDLATSENDAVLVGGMIFLPDTESYIQHVVSLVRSSDSIIIIDALEENGYVEMSNIESSISFLKKRRHFQNWALQVVGVNID